MGVESGGGLFDEKRDGLADFGEGCGFFHFLGTAGGAGGAVTAIGNGVMEGSFPL